MKAKRVVALVAGAALATGMAVGMTACKKDDKPKGPEALGTATLNVADYASEFKPLNSSRNNSQKGYKSINKLAIDQYSGDNLVVYEKNSKYNVYSIALEKDVLTEIDVQPQVISMDIYSESGPNPVGELPVITVTDNTDPMKPKTAYYMADGSALLASDVYVHVMAMKLTAYLGTDNETSNILGVMGSKADDEVIKYYKIVKDKDTNEESYVAINASDIKLYSSDYNKGEIIGGLKQHLYNYSSKTKPVEGDMEDYTVEINGYNYNFYKNGEKTGTVDMMDKYELACVGTNFYYYSQMLVDSDATEGYNIVEVSQAGIALKYDYQLYKYDIVANTVTELNYDVVILDMEAMYNYTAKTYDAAYVTGYKMIDGVAYTGDVTYGKVTYVTDKDLGVAYDLSGYYGLGSEAPELLKVNDSTYIVDIGNYQYPYYIVLDENLKPVNSVEFSPYRQDADYMAEGLVLINSASGLIGFTDKTGKVVIEPKYSVDDSLTFYDGIVYLYEASVSGEGNKVLVKNDGTVVANLTSLEDLTATVEKEVDVYDGYYTLTTTTTDETTHDFVSKTVAYYTFGGTLLKSFSLGEYDYYYTQNLSDGSKLIVVTKTDATTSATTYEYYKLAK